MNDGGPAYPHFVLISLPDETKDYRPEPGMSLRDYFAARALQSIVGVAAFNQEAEDMMKRAGIDPAKDTEGFIAMLAYDFADAMLAARNSSPSAKSAKSAGHADHDADTSTHD